MTRKIFVKAITFCLITLMSMGMLTACSNDDDNGGAPSDVFHPINASTRTLHDVIERDVYTPQEFGEVIGSWPMLSAAGTGVADLAKNTLKTNGFFS